ncbi:MAG: hypothetical protein KJO69_05145 [Gammaproteobacteria bacterium]|nr:hypothetical protein [Gammaproteobacteria bacterium]
MSKAKFFLIRPRTLFLIVLVAIVIKYFYDQSQSLSHKSEPDRFTALENTMNNRLRAIPDGVKRRINLTDGRYDYSPHQASYQVLMHVSELFTGNAIANVSKDCTQWTEDFAVQLKPRSGERSVLFDYEAYRVESLTGMDAEIRTKAITLFNGEQEIKEEKLNFKKQLKELSLTSNGETLTLDPETKLNIEVANYVLAQIAQGNYELEYYSEPSDFTQYPIRNVVSIEAFSEDYQLDNMWLVKTTEYDHDGEEYTRSNSVLELINDRATTLYAATLDEDGVLYELILSDFEYKPSRCRQLVII